MSGGITIEPFNVSQLNPNSHNLRLAPKLCIYVFKDFLDIRERNLTLETEIPEDGLVLKPGHLYLGASMEYTRSRRLIPMINGRSSLARLGLTVHQTGGFGDVGFVGTWTLEMTVIHPVKIYPRIQVAQLCWFRPEGEIDQLYNGKYAGQRGVTASKIWEELGGE